MSFGLCCCISLRKGVIAIGVICMLCSMVLVLLNTIFAITFEEHVQACKFNISVDYLEAFPRCESIIDASILMAARIYIYSQLLVWIAEALVSSLLIVSAVKKRNNLMIPWAVVTILVIGVMIWSIYQSASKNQLLYLLLQLASVLTAAYFLIVVISYSVQLSKNLRRRKFSIQHSYMIPRMSIGSISEGSPSEFCHCSERKSSTTSVIVDRPPAYTPFLTSKKGPIPLGLGIRN